MSDRTLHHQRRSKKKGGKLIPALCNVFGTLILLAVIAISIPLTVPRWMGYDIYQVVSGSMEPTIPVGSVIYVSRIAPEEVQPEDIIAFQSGDSIVTHRVLENHLVEGEFVTKGDANVTEDFSTTPYDCLIGRVERHLPIAGELVVLYTTNIGKAYVICFAACGAMFNLLASRLREQARRENETNQERTES